MCGIAGLVVHQASLDPGPARDLVARMGARIAHRGPDMAGHWSDDLGRCHLAHRRLSVLDTSEAGRQPMLDASGRHVLVFNGEIYNWRELRAELEAAGERFATRCDTEVLLAGLAREGERFLPRLDGMFAFAWYDTVTGRLVLARDRAGEKPLYVAAGSGWFGFASELRPMLELPGIAPALSETALAAYLLLRYVPAPASMIEGVAKLRPGHLMVVEPDGRIVERRWHAWEVDPGAPATPQRFAETCERVEAALVTSLRRRLVSDVPLGLFLSSGIDSSLACALAARALGHPVQAFTVGFDGDAGSEHRVAAAIAGGLGAEHHHQLFSGTDFAGWGARAGAMLDEPNGDRSFVPTAMLSAFARQHVTVALSGDGADELFGGYERYRGFDAAGAPAHPEAALRDYLERLLPVFGWQAVEAALPEGAAAVAEWLSDFAAPFQHPGRAPLHALRQFDFATYLPGAVLAKVDRAAMAVGLETRTPFLSPEVMALASGLDAGECRNDAHMKLVLRQIAARHLGPTIARLPKRGFGMPPAVFDRDAALVRDWLAAALEVLAADPFFADRPGSLLAIARACQRNNNSAWATIVLGQWVESLRA